MPVFTSIGLALGALPAVAAATGAAVVSGVTAVGGLALSASQMLMGGNSPKVNIPTAQVPAAAAPGARTDTGASVTVGTSAEDIKSQRVSTGSRRTGTSSTSQGDVLGGLGRSGLSI